MGNDITDLLQDWDYDPEHSVRVLRAADGRLLIQVRQPMGIEQYEMDGRPDGSRPFGHDSYLAMIEERLERLGPAAEFWLSGEEIRRLRNESLLFYYRYIVLFQLNDFERVARDTGHNLRLCALIQRHCRDEEERQSVLQYQPYIIRMNAMARCILAVQEGDRPAGAAILGQALRDIEALEPIPLPAFQFERSRAQSYIGNALEQLAGECFEPLLAMETELGKALDEENYEQAAELRDQIRNLIDKGQSA